MQLFNQDTSNWENEILKSLPAMNEKTRKILRWVAIACAIIATITFFILNKAPNDKRSKNNTDSQNAGDEQAAS